MMADLRAHVALVPIGALLIGTYAAAIALAPNATTALLLIALPSGAWLCWWTIGKPGRWVLLFLGAALLLPPLPVEVGGNGAHPALAVAALGIGAGLVRLRDWRIRVDLLNVSVLLYLFILLASLPLAILYSGLEVASGSFERVLLFSISVYIFLYVRWSGSPFPDSFRLVRFLFWIAIASALFASIDFYYQLPAPAGFGAQFVWLPSGVYRRAQGIFYEASTLGNFCAFFLVMVAAALLRPRREAPISRALLLAGGTILFAALIFSYSRASLLNLIAAVTVLLYLHRGHLKLRRIAAAVLVCFAAGAGAAYALLPTFAGAWWLRIRVSFEYFGSATEAVLSGRPATWRALGEFLAGHPWHALLGIGYKTLPYSDFLGRPLVADNMYLSALVETGMVGLAALCLFSLSILRAAHRAARSAREPASFLGTWLLCFWVGQLFQMMSGDLLTYWRVLPVYFTVLALAVREAEDAPSGASSLQNSSAASAAIPAARPITAG
jgi:O-antigen ligase